MKDIMNLHHDIAGEIPNSVTDLEDDRRSGHPTIVSLPTDRPRPARDHRLARESFDLPPDLERALDRIPVENRGQRAILLSAFAVLLRRYSGDDQIVVGMMQDAVDASSENCSKPLAAFIACEIDLSSNPPFRELAERLQQKMSESDNQRPNTEAVTLYDGARDPLQGRFAAWQFLFHDASNVDCEERRPTPLEDFNAELVMQVRRNSRGLEIQLLFIGELFETATIRRMIANFEVLLRGIAERPASRISNLPLLSKAEHVQLFEEWNRLPKVETSTPEPHFSEAISARAAQTPSAVAVIFNDRLLSYRELDEQSNQFARQLQRRGVGPGAIVAFCLPRSPELVIGVLAVLKTGGAFVTLESSYPAEQLRSMLAESGAFLLITNPQLRSAVHAEISDVEIDQLVTASSAELATALEMNIAADATAVILFTSGTTGRPKAIPRSHNNLRANSRLYSTIGLTPSDRHVFKTALDSTLIFREIFWPLITGGRMVIVPSSENLDTSMLVGLMFQHKITFITLVPSLLRLLLEHQDFAACTSLRHVACFGEPLHTDLRQRFRECLTAELSSIYGTTEASSLCRWHCRRDGTQPLGNLGHRTGDWQLYVLDSQMQPVPIGVTGELYASGPKMAAGYLNQQQLTDERFLPHPFNADRDARVYRTGDRVCWRSDGSLEFIGRMDDQIKIRGTGWSLDRWKLRCCKIQMSMKRQSSPD